jgi:hypothetical protein
MTAGVRRRVVGILSLSDIASDAGREIERKKKDVSYAAVGKTLQTVCKPRRGGALAAA